MTQNTPPDGRDALTAILAQGFLHTGLMLTDAHELHAEALPFLQKAVALCPDLAPAIEGLANACQRRAATLAKENRLCAAENYLRKGLSLGVNETALSRDLAAILLKRAREFSTTNTRPFAAQTLLHEVLLLRPELNEAEILLKELASLKTLPPDDDIVERLRQQEIALRNDGGSLLENLSNQAIELFNNGDIAEAEAAFRKALTIQEMPVLIDGLVRTLCARAVDGFNAIKFADAETALWETLSLQPDNKDAAQILGHVTGVVPRYVHNIMDRDYADCARELRKALSVKDVVGAPYVRKGGQADGGYVMVDRGLNNAVVYSLGIGDNVSWDMDMAALGCQIFQYDHTIEHLPVEHPNFHWSKRGVAGTETPDPTFRTMDQLIDANGHRGRNDLILKVDIECAEWSMFANMPEETLCQFSQIVGEFHRLARVIDPAYRETMFAALAKINKYFQLVHAHANNFTGMAVIGGVPVYYCMELTFVRRADHAFTDTARAFPTPLDYPCIPKLADLYLGNFGG